MGGWVVDPQLDEISRTDGIIKLEPRMMRLLARLAESQGRVVSTDELLETVWTGVIVGPASVYQAISQLRKLLGDTDPKPTYIATVPRKGYRLIASVEQINDLTRPQQRPPDPASSAITKPRQPLMLMALGGVGAALVALVCLTVARPTEEVTTGRPAAATQFGTQGEIRTIAVMPFSSMPEAGSDESFASSITLLIRDRLARFPELVVIASNSSQRAAEANLSVSNIGAKLKARYLLRGSVRREGNRIDLNTYLLDTLSGSQVWSGHYAGQVAQFSETREDVARDVTTNLAVKFIRQSSAPIDFDLYALYDKGQRLLASQHALDIETARHLFDLAINANPDFAPAHLGKAQAIIEKIQLTKPQVPRDYEEAKASFERATQIDANLGEAWFGRAFCNAANISEADQMFRRAMQLAPNDSAGYANYSEYLVERKRFEEASQMIDVARRLDPLSPKLAIRKLFLTHTPKADFEGYEKLVREILELDPDYYPALVLLSNLIYQSGGNVAEAIRLSERSLAVKDTSKLVGTDLAGMYLDINDPDAATAAATVWATPIYSQLTEVAMYQGDVARAASLAVHCDRSSCPFSLDESVAEAIRDQAMRAGKYSEALNLFKSVAVPDYYAENIVRFRVVYAHLVALAGNAKESREMAASLLKLLDDTDRAGSVEDWLARDRAAVYALLGDNDGALKELETSQRQNQFTRWWYTGELDPIFKPLHGNPRFQALVANARKHSDEQRALVDAMRKRGEIPLRPAPAASATRTAAN